MADWSGAQAVNFAPADGDRITGALTVNDGVTWTWNAGVDLTMTGVFDMTINGRIVANLTLDNPGTLRSSSSAPLCDSIGSFVMNAVDAGCVMKGLIFYHLQYGMYLNSSYTAHNIDLDNVIFDSCNGAIVVFQAACTTTWGAVEVRNSTTVSTSFRLFSQDAAQTTTFSSLWIHDCFLQGYLFNLTTGTTNVTELILENVRYKTTTSIITRTAGSPVMNITKIWAFNVQGPAAGSSGLFGGWAGTGTLNVDGGIINLQDGLFSAATAEANITFDDVDFYMPFYAYLAAGNFTNCYFEAGYNTGTAFYAPGTKFVPSDTGGVADDVSSYNTVPFFTCDSITSARSAPNYPLSNSSDLAVSSVTTDGAVFTYTPSCPGETFIYIYSAAITVNNWWDLADYQGICIHSHFEWQDRSGNAQKRQTLTARARTLDDMLTPGKTYKARVMTKVPWGHSNGHGMYWGTEQSFTTSAGGGVGMLLGGGLLG